MLRDVLSGAWFSGPWRAVPVLGITQIIAWGAIFYSPVLTVPLIAAERGWSVSFTMGGFSLGLFVAGLAAPLVGRSIDRFGGHVVMTAGSLIGALGLFGLGEGRTSGRLSRGLAGAGPGTFRLALRSGVRDARAHLRNAGAAADHRAHARRRICLDGRMADDAFPDRRGGLARLLSRLCRAARAWCARRCTRSRCREAAPSSSVHAEGTSAAPITVLPAQGLTFVLVIAAFAAYAFVPSALSAHLLAIYRPLRDRSGDRGGDRHIVRTGASVGANLRAVFLGATCIRSSSHARPWGCW